MLFFISVEDVYKATGMTKGELRALLGEKKATIYAARKKGWPRRLWPILARLSMLPLSTVAEASRRAKDGEKSI